MFPSLRLPMITALAALIPASAFAQPAPAAPPAAAPAPAEPAAAAPAPGAPADAAPAPAAPAPEAAAPAPAPAPPADAEAGPKKLSVGTEGFFQPSINLQGWFYVNNQAPNTPDTNFTFRLRRAELKVKGEIIPKLFGYTVMVDPAKTLRPGTATVNVNNQQPPPVDPTLQETVTIPTLPADNSILQDFYITFMSEYADVSLGEFKTPVSYEGMNSATKLLFPERALVSRQYGDRRDVGIKAEKQFEYFGFLAGVWNGPGTNQVDNDNQKDVGLRLEAYPMKGIMVGGVGYVGIGQRSHPTTKDRVEGDVRVEMENALLQAEYIHGWDGGTGNRLEGHGAYAALGYTFAEKYQPVVRVGFLDADIDTVDNTVMQYDIGFNYYLLKQELKFQAAFGVRDSATPGVSTIDDFTLAAQLSF